ncbi:pyruvate:ferredoxin (flavodoxin) oxidoreductase [Treponema sp. J25]|uniref:pyruvate:ferredoxin (flavodoxin) oxidoreductase n=1 Tax=Treponema sp. J25 TaxID=2094121 RepID=UPI0010439D9B|nr:pyruvate:ferredoxin (flavodoxin) oxidoreductase [Treponema sp. J25]TCW61166.1 pyruvate:ferredoxin (flavodoxin) oxidoreductase [Treponema sp. J25]
MSDKKMVMIDGNTAAAHIAHACSEVIAIYPITPSSPMGELSDEFSAQGRKNLWGTVPQVVEMQSEAGAAGAVHGALTTGALSTTFTASQGLLLMIPNMYKIAGELTPTVFHIAARAIAAQGLSIFGDHQDVMACRQTGFAMLASNNVQEVMDLALIAHASTLESRVPFLHFFDGFRTSHEVQKVEELSYEVMKQLISDELVAAHRQRGLNPEHPAIRGTSQNPDVYFTGRETVNKYYKAVPAIVQKYMDQFAKITGRQYKVYQYYGASDAERVIVIMGSGAEPVEEIVDYLNKKGEKVGVLKVHLFRPFDSALFVAALPATVKAIAVMDRTKEPGSLGEPLYEDVRTAIGEVMGSGKSQFKVYPKIVGGRYGLGSAEFTPAMAKAIFDNLKKEEPKNHFTVGIYDDVAFTSLEWDEHFDLEEEGVFEALFYGLGSDGTVGANKNSIKIIGDATDNNAQGYFVYDSKKAGTVTVSHLRFGKKPIKKPYLVSKADFIACHKFSFIEKVEMLSRAKKGATFLLASPYPADQVWDHLPQEVQKQIIDKELKFYVIDAISLAEKAGMGGRINVIMQTAFFKISGVLPEAEAVELIKQAIKKTYGKKGEEIVKKNIATIDMALEGVHQVNYPKQVTSKSHMLPPVPETAPKFVKEVLGEIIANRGDKLPVSKLPDDGTYPTGTTKYEKRNIAEKIPVWDPETCIQCGNCTMVCPHAVIRMKAYEPKYLVGAPATFKSTDAKGKEFEGMKFTLQVAPEDCTGCGACVNICPAKNKNNPELKAINLEPQIPLRETEAKNWDFFLKIPNTDSKLLNLNVPKGIGMKQPLFEFSGACAGCGETPYIKLMSQLFGDRLLIANATGCSSIYGGNLPTTPYTTRDDGRGPVWSNSLFEDAAEFGFGMRLTSDKLAEHAREVAEEAKQAGIQTALLDKILSNPQSSDEEIETQRKYVEELKAALAKETKPLAKNLLSLADHFIKRSVWIIGGDGWAYDIGYGGLDHVIASGRNVNILVLDTEVYSNTGGQMSKATPVGAIAKFAAAGKETTKKDLGAMAMSYGYVYVARVAMGANIAQTIKAFREAESYDGPSIIIAYSHCINHGIDMMKGMDQQKAAVTSGVWPLYRYDPRLKEQGKNPFQLDSKEPSTPVEDFMYKEVRFKALKAADPARADLLLAKAKAQIERTWKEYKYLADRPF